MIPAPSEHHLSIINVLWENILLTLSLRGVKYCLFFKFFLVRHKLPFFWPKLLPALFWPKLLPALFLKTWYPCPFEILAEALCWPLLSAGNSYRVFATSFLGTDKTVSVNLYCFSAYWFKHQHFVCIKFNGSYPAITKQTPL
jgi:hypothetical protein